MPFARKRPPLTLTRRDQEVLTRLSQARAESFQRVERARMMPAYAGGESISSIARQLATNRPKVERCIDKALQLGPMVALEDLPGRGRPSTITAEARAWVVSIACQKPKDFGYSCELWTTELLARHIRGHCREAGHPSLDQIGRGTVSKILTKSEVRPHKIEYYLERRDPEFEVKMAQVLHVYAEVNLLREKKADSAASLLAVISYDEKPGIQAIENTAPDLPPVPGKHSCVARDHEYIRHGTMTLMAGIGLLTGMVHGNVTDRHRSREFISFLKQLDAFYAPNVKIRIVLDNHSAHVSKETRAYLATVPNRFEFVFTPKHGSWLNLIETFFAKMAKTVFRGIRVKSKEELRERLLKYLDEVNEMSVIFRWKYRLDSLSVA